MTEWEMTQPACHRGTAPVARPNTGSALKGWEAVVANLLERHAEEFEARVSMLCGEGA
jgi:hypothetical protein